MNSPNIQVPYADCLPTPEFHVMLNHAIWLKQPLRSKKKEAGVRNSTSVVKYKAGGEKIDGKWNRLLPWALICRRDLSLAQGDPMQPRRAVLLRLGTPGINLRWTIEHLIFSEIKTFWRE